MTTTFAASSSEYAIQITLEDGQWSLRVQHPARALPDASVCMYDLDTPRHRLRSRALQDMLNDLGFDGPLWTVEGVLSSPSDEGEDDEAMPPAELAVSWSERWGFRPADAFLERYPDIAKTLGASDGAPVAPKTGDYVDALLASAHEHIQTLVQQAGLPPTELCAAVRLQPTGDVTVTVGPLAALPTGSIYDRARAEAREGRLPIIVSDEINDLSFVTSRSVRRA